MASRVQIPLAVETVIVVETNKEVVTPVVGATIVITNRVDSSAATTYGAETGGATITPTTNANGQVSGWLEEGVYTIVASGGVPSIAPTTYNFDAVTGRVSVAAGKGITEKSIEALIGQSIAAIKEALVPPGALTAHAGASAPSGWLLCDGTSYLRATYAALFSAIGTTWGSVDGTHFTVPDLRGRSPLGAGTGSGLSARTLGQTLGVEKVGLTVNQMPKHRHNVTPSTPGYYIMEGNTPINKGWAVNESGSATFGGAGSYQLTCSEAGNNESHENMSPVAVTNFIIKT